jgi:immunoglobulin-binding protein 1
VRQQQPQKKKEKDEEQEILKARQWDDWKDDHPKGEGNKNDNYFKRG